MPMLAEYALTPDVFDVTSYASPEVCGLHLQSLKEVLLQEGLVRNLRDGAWAKYFVETARPWHMRGKELLKKLATQKRLVGAKGVLQQDPTTDGEWCDEAVASHQTQQLSGILTTEDVAKRHVGTTVVSAVSKLAGASWWTARSPSMRLRRSFSDYESALDLVLRHANSLMLIDPHIDPTDFHQYESLFRLLEQLRHRSSKPLVELHRAAWYDGGNDKRPQIPEVVAALTPRLSTIAKTTGVSFDVFLWDEIHDRYLISDLVGISLPYGFATTASPNAVTTWTRLGRLDGDEIAREYHPNYRAPRHKFRI